MNERSKNHELENLVVEMASALLDGKISAEELAEFERLLLGNPEAVDVYYSYVGLHLALADGVLDEGGKSTAGISSTDTLPPLHLPDSMADNNLDATPDQCSSFNAGGSYRVWGGGNFFAQFVWALTVFAAVVAGSMVSAVVLASVSFRQSLDYARNELRQPQSLQDAEIPQKPADEKREYIGPDLWWEEDHTGTAEIADLPVTNGLALHLDASKGVFSGSDKAVAEDGDLVRVWEDAQQGIQAVQDQSQRCPVWIAQGIRVGENRFAPVLRFSGRQFFNADGLVPLVRGKGKAISVLAVVKFLPSVGFERQHILGFGKVGDKLTLYSFASTAEDDHYRPRNTLFCNRRDADYQEQFCHGTDDTLPRGIFHICSLVDTGTKGSVYVNGVALSENSDLDCKTLEVDRAMIGGLPYGGENAEKACIYGEIAALIIFDRVISAAERCAVESYLGRRYALPLH